MKDIFCSYYTDSQDIVSYMVSMLDISNDDIVLEPSAGNGLFIDELLKIKSNIHIDALEINKNAVSILQEKYRKNSNISIRETDTLLDTELDYFEATDGYYSKIIGNPPYGAWQDYEKRDLLKKKYAGQYVKETYSLFLLRCVSLLKKGGKLSFIIPDTFLFLNLHQKLRTFLLTKTKILEILIFPSKFFPGINFGYSNLSIITLEKNEKNICFKNSIRIIKGFKYPEEFKLLHTSDKKKLQHLEVFKLKQSDIFDNAQHRFIISSLQEYQIITNSNSKLGDIADIVTGFYSGDNTRFIRVKNKSVKGSKNYEVVDEELISECNSLIGIDKDEVYIPYVKSSSKIKYAGKSDDWFVRWDKKTVHYYNTNKKSRFQNSSFYFKKGICIPMVKSSTINAFYMENRVFDQSLVGIFPKDEKKIYYILGLMNSDIVNRIIHLLNPTANNSSNYIKLIPYKEPDENQVIKITELVRNALFFTESGNIHEADILHTKINLMFNSIYLP